MFAFTVCITNQSRMFCKILNGFLWSTFIIVQFIDYYSYTSLHSVAEWIMYNSGWENHNSIKIPKKWASDWYLSLSLFSRYLEEWLSYECDKFEYNDTKSLHIRKTNLTKDGPSDYIKLSIFYFTFNLRQVYNINCLSYLSNRYNWLNFFRRNWIWKSRCVYKTIKYNYIGALKFSISFPINNIFK